MSTTATLAAYFEGDQLWDANWKEAHGEATLRKRSQLEDDNVDLILYSSWFCPFAQRAWIAAEESGVNYKWVEVNPYEVDATKPGGYTKLSLPLETKRQLHPEFVEASPRGLVPGIVDVSTGKNLWESMPVSEFIDAKFNDGNLMTRDPQLRAELQIWVAHCSERVSKEYYRALVEQDATEKQAALDRFYNECRMLANAMSTDGPFFLGNEFSLVDVALAPFWQRITVVGSHFLGLDLPNKKGKEFTRLNEWWNAAKERPSVRDTICSPDRLIATYHDYSQGKATSDAAKNFIK
eukprot:CAMPEP_0198120614 /NCGR_PEP_ID=MMETSP1442-20131203/29662_1 /TAXON_ID= /ORGANISM="Craspedostauros australis, Strain CCMP3328" /LENGTH=293 /DNA_ID=CAMNT_0043779285 /DNA_START=38 /DNA_END=919 /DNA_ORIENTATION=+